MTLTEVVNKLERGESGFEGVTFESDITIHHTYARGGYGISFKKCIFKGNIRFEGITNYEYLTFFDCEFEKDIEIVRCNIMKFHSQKLVDFQN